MHLLEKQRQYAIQFMLDALQVLIILASAVEATTSYFLKPKTVETMCRGSCDAS